MKSIPKNLPENKSKTSAGRLILERAQIIEVWPALGGGQLRYGRGRAFWRGGDGFSIAIDLPRGLWYDHVTGTGGGILDLIQTVQGCNRKQALAWLANFYGVSLGQPLSAGEKRRYAKLRERVHLLLLI